MAPYTTPDTCSAVLTKSLATCVWPCGRTSTTLESRSSVCPERVLCLLGQEITSFCRQAREVHKGIVGNWKSRWTCMSFQEDAVTTEIETKHTRYNVNGAHLRLCTSLFLTAASFLFLFTSSFFVFLPFLASVQ